MDQLHRIIYARRFLQGAQTLFQRLRLAIASGLTALLASFFLINIAGVIWAVYVSPHDGQAGVGPFLISVIAAPALAVITFLLVFWRLRARR